MVTLHVMPVVFVHGNPETTAVWDPLRAELASGDTIALALPGFGVPAPAGFGATMDEYVIWLVNELETIGEPVDLVGHDWGGGFVLRVASTRPDLIRSWVSDVPGLFADDFVWHDFAKIWQTPGAGEKFYEDQMAASVADQAALYESLGISPPAARSFAEAMSPEMARCILALYRSATLPALRAWGGDVQVAATRPGLVVVGAADPFTGGTEKSQRMAGRLGARFEEMAGQGHWWMLGGPAAGARAIEAFWASI